MTSSFFRRDKLLNFIGEENHPDFIVVLNSRKRQNSSDFGNNIVDLERESGSMVYIDSVGGIIFLVDSNAQAL